MGIVKGKKKYSIQRKKKKTLLLDKFEEGVRISIRWKPEVLAQKTQELKVNDKFYFKAYEFLTATQIRSFFSREKAKHRRVKINENDIKTENEGFLQDYLALEETADREILFQTCRKAFNENNNDENPAQLNRGIKHHAF